MASSLTEWQPPRGLAAEPVDLVAEAGRHLVHEVHGDPEAPALLFLHGITGSRHYWDRAIPVFRDAFHVVLPDLLGFGSSPKPHVRYDIGNHALAVRSFLEARRLTDRPLRVVAHSLGALITLDYVLRWPGHVREAVLINVPNHPDRPTAHRDFLFGSGNYRRLLGRASIRSTLWSWVHAGPVMGLRYLFAFSPKIAADSRRWTFHSLTSTIEHCLLSYRLRASLAAHAERAAGDRPRVLLLHGARDQVASVDYLDGLPEALGAELHVLSGTGHHPFRTHTRTIVREVDAFLTREPHR